MVWFDVIWTQFLWALYRFEPSVIIIRYFAQSYIITVTVTPQGHSFTVEAIWTLQIICIGLPRSNPPMYNMYFIRYRVWCDVKYIQNSRPVKAKLKRPSGWI